MAIVSGNKLITVADLIARDQITLKKRGQRVEVLDSTADIRTDGSAIYVWNGTEWILDSEETDKTKLVSDDVNLDSFQEFADAIKAVNSRVDALVIPKVYVQNIDPTTQETVQENSIWLQVP